MTVHAPARRGGFYSKKKPRCDSILTHGESVGTDADATCPKCRALVVKASIRRLRGSEGGPRGQADFGLLCHANDCPGEQLVAVMGQANYFACVGCGEEGRR